MHPYVQTPPVCPQCSPVHLYLLGGICMWYGDAGALHMFGHPHLFGCLLMCPMPPHICMLPWLSVCSTGYLHVIWGNTPYIGVLGSSLHLLGFWCLSVPPLDVHCASPCTFLVAHYVSSLYYHGYDYYSDDCGVFWYVISFISDHGSLFDSTSCNIWSVWCGSATTPDTKILLMCATAATSIFTTSSGLCQLCHGFSTDSFFFRVEPPPILYFVYYMFGVCSGVCFLLSGAMLDAIFTPTGSTIRVCTIAFPWSLSVAGICATWSWSCMYRVATPSTMLSRGEPYATQSAVPSHPIYMVGHTALGAWQRVTWSLHLPYIVGRGLLFQVWFQLMT